LKYIVNYRDSGSQNNSNNLKKSDTEIPNVFISEFKASQNYLQKSSEELKTAENSADLKINLIKQKYQSKILENEICNNFKGFEKDCNLKIFELEKKITLLKVGLNKIQEINKKLNENVYF